MKTVVQKGIAGLGNRFQVLGRCVDIALEHKAQIIADWRDSSWGDDFSYYFSSDIIASYPPITLSFPGVKPEWWNDKINAHCAKALAGEDFARATPAIIADDWETLVVCQYKAKYSDAIFRHIDFHRRIYDKYNKMWPPAEEWVCWHIRATDKTGGNAFKILERIINLDCGGYKAIITDNLDIKNEAVRNGIICQSIIPPVPEKGGVHHSSKEYLADSGISRQELNDSALVDMLIGINAANFFATCENSSYSQLIQRWRNVK
jgi:hypothetical protein